MGLTFLILFFYKKKICLEKYNKKIATDQSKVSNQFLSIISLVFSERIVPIRLSLSIIIDGSSMFL